MIKCLMIGLCSFIWLCRSSRDGLLLFCIAKKSKQKSLVPLNRSAYRNGHAFYSVPKGLVFSPCFSTH